MSFDFDVLPLALATLHAIHFDRQQYSRKRKESVTSLFLFLRTSLFISSFSKKDIYFFSLCWMVLSVHPSCIFVAVCSQVGARMLRTRSWPGRSRLNVYLIKRSWRAAAKEEHWTGFRPSSSSSNEVDQLQRSSVFVWNHRLGYNTRTDGRADGQRIREGRSRSQGSAILPARPAPSALVTFKMKRLFSSPPSLSAIFPFFCQLQLTLVQLLFLATHPQPKTPFTTSSTSIRYQSKTAAPIMPVSHFNDRQKRKISRPATRQVITQWPA